VFQPHRYTRLRDLFDDFTAAFDDVDVLYLMEVYPAGEEPIPEVSSRRLYEALCARGVLASAFGPQTVRMVTHYDVDRPAIRRALEIVRDVL
jgi:UDP-N-acetylmuramate-alanine ligase